MKFGDERFRSHLVSLADIPVAQLVTRSIDRLGEWAGAKRFEDDMSLVAIDWAGP